MHQVINRVNSSIELTRCLAAKFFCKALISPWNPEDASTLLSALHMHMKNKCYHKRMQQQKDLHDLTYTQIRDYYKFHCWIIKIITPKQWKAKGSSKQGVITIETVSNFQEQDRFK